MMPPVFEVLSASTAVKAKLGNPPNMRLFPFGEADQNTTKPYVTWQLLTGVPENYLGQLPDADSYRIQLDIWAATQVSANQTAEAVRDAIEPHAYLLNSGGTTRDPETRNYRYMLDVEFQTPR
jgi:hypothetical protein